MWTSPEAITRSFVVIGLLGIASSFLVISMLGLMSMEALVSGIAIAILLGIVYLLIYLGYNRLAPRFLIISLWIYITCLMVYVGGLNQPVFGVFTLLTFASGLVLGPRWALVAGVAAAVTATIFFVFDVRTVASADERNALIENWTVISIIPIVSGILIYYAMFKLQSTSQALYNSENRFRSLVEQSPLSTVVFDKNGRPILYNQASTALWQLTEEQLAYFKSDYNLLEDEEIIARGILPYIERGLAGDIVHVPAALYDTTDYAQEGAYSNRLHVRGHIYPIKNKDGDVEEIVITHEDISEVVRVEEALRQAQKLESMAIMSGGIAHDFNNLLTIMMAQASLAQNKTDSQSAASGHIDKIIRAADRAAILTRQLLVYSGRGQFDIKPVNLNTVIEENIHLLKVVLPDNVSLSTQLKETLPILEADEAQIQQLVMNLIINGAEAAQGARGAIHIRTDELFLQGDEPSFNAFMGEAIAPGQYILLSVQDDGIGMDEETISRIFDPFFSTKKQGRGLGMAAALGIVRSHMGALSIKSKPGQGTTITVVFPPISDIVDIEVAQVPPTAKGPLTGFVLVIDDEESIRDAIEDTLTMYGLRCVAFSDGASAIEAFRTEQDLFSLAIIDLKMPGLSGEETCQRLRALCPDLPIIVSSGYNEPEVTHKLSQMGMVSFLEKPYSFDVLLERVAKIVS
ncbi:MAG: response regulator [Chloroflexota bacterium]